MGTFSGISASSVVAGSSSGCLDCATGVSCVSCDSIGSKSSSVLCSIPRRPSVRHALLTNIYRTKTPELQGLNRSQRQDSAFIKEYLAVRCHNHFAEHHAGNQIINRLSFVDIIRHGRFPPGLLFLRPFRQNHRVKHKTSKRILIQQLFHCQSGGNHPAKRWIDEFKDHNRLFNFPDHRTLYWFAVG